MVRSDRSNAQRAARLITPHLPRPLSAAARQRQALQRAQGEAKQASPKLEAILDSITAELKENLSAGRFQYQQSLKRVYALVFKWRREDQLSERIETIAALRGKTVRQNANPFGVFLGSISDRDRRTISRWAIELKKALSKNIKPKRLIKFMRSKDR
jgi:hypothetical protein